MILLFGAFGAQAEQTSTPVSLEQLPQLWRDDQARELSLSALRGHRVVLSMAYATCHRICPIAIGEMQRMQRLADARGEHVDFVIVGYDPENDSAAAWHRYRVDRRLTRDNWLFLTGSVAATRQLARQLGFGYWRLEEHVMHDSRAIVFDAQGMQSAALGAPISQWADAL